MPRKKLALVAFEKGEGPWIRAKGNEAGVSVRPLLDGEELYMVTGDSQFPCPEGVIAIELAAGQMFKFIKRVQDGVVPSKTFVEILLNA